jgi:hypothetical protein
MLYWMAIEQCIQKICKKQQKQQKAGMLLMRREEFKMERTGLLEVGDVLPITEGKLPNSYYYTLGKAYAMSANYVVSQRIKSREGTVVDVKETEKGYFVTVEFDE